MLGRLLGAGRPGRPLLRMLLLQALLLLQLVLLLLLLLVGVVLRCARNPLSIFHTHCVMCAALQEHCCDAVMHEGIQHSIVYPQGD